MLNVEVSLFISFCLAADTAPLCSISSLPADIQPGYGMVYDRATSQYKSVSCAANTYGVSAREYGLKFTPCKPCARGLTSPAASTGEAACTNPAGWGFNGFTAEVCGSGYWAAAGARLPCTACPPNRNTTGDASAPFFTDTSLPEVGGRRPNGKGVQPS
jgi:hypothetical protein